MQRTLLLLLQALFVGLDHLLDHLAADGACLAGGQVTVVTVGQVDADLGCSLHLELVHSLTSLGDIDLVVALHNAYLLLLSSEENTFRRKHFLFRGHSFTKDEKAMNVNWRKEWKRFVMNNQSTFLKKKEGFVDDYIYEWIQ